MVKLKLKKLRKIALLLSVLIVSQRVVAFSYTENDLQNKINENNSHIEKLEEKKEEINEVISNQYTELESIVSEIESKSEELNKAKSDVQYYENLINDVQVEIDNINYEISSLTEEIEMRENLIKEKEKEIEKTRELLDNRIRSYSKIDMTTEIVFMVLESKSLTSFLENIENAYKIIKLDRELINTITKFNEEMAAEKLVIQSELEKIEENKVNVEAKKKDLVLAQEEFLIKQYNEESKMNELVALENQKSGIINQLSEEEAELTHEIGELLIYNEGLQQELNNLFNEINSQGPTINETASVQGFIRPGYGVITDSYGPRINPVTFEEGFHNGVDFADPHGSNVYASKSGTVVHSGWISGYGYTIIIDHGSGVQTLYAHNSELLASVGQAVSQGEVVALVGSTGMSTGPHIHFEIRINGQPVNPLDYL